MADKADTSRREKMLRIARGMSVILLRLGLTIFILGAGVATGRITELGDFPMRVTPDWGKSWGVVLLVASVAYMVGPILLFLRPSKGWVAMMIICALNVVPLGVPIMISSTEILYNLFQEQPRRPEWAESVWAYFVFLNIGILIALYKYSAPKSEGAQHPKRAAQAS